MIDPLLLAALVAGLASVLATRAAEVFARRRSLLDIPNDRSAHDTPTPRIGGLGIVTGTLLGWLAAEGWRDDGSTAIILAGLALGAVGLLDDVRRTSVLGKYLGQLAAAAIVAVVLQPTLELRIGDMAWAVGGLPAVVVTTVGLTAFVNAVNFMDGIDGLIGGVTIVATVAAVGLVAPAAWPIVVPLAAASAGFLVWNHWPATIFMGDAGSHFLGLVLGASLLRQDAATIDVVPILLLVSPLLIDTGFTLVRRARAGRDLFAGHREHLYQRLVIAGRSHREVSAGYAGATVIAGAVALSWARAPAAAQVCLLISGAVAAVAYAAVVANIEAASGQVLDGDAARLGR